MAFNFMGTGTSYVGRSSEPGDGTYVATDWIVLFWLPLLPLRWRRVTGVTKQRYMIRFLVFSFETAPWIGMWIQSIRGCSGKSSPTAW